MVGAEHVVAFTMSLKPEGTPTLSIEGHVATIALQRPSVANRLEVADLEALHKHLERVNAAPEVLALQFTASGKHFCSGFNVGQVGTQGANAGEMFESLAAAIESSRPITLAVIHGGVYGGATDLALACDFRLGTTACEMFVPAARLGLHFYRGGLERYVTRLGLAAAKRVMLAGETFDAQAMLACGFLDRVVAPDALNDTARSLVQGLGDMAPLSLLPMKQHLNAIARAVLDAEQIARDIAAAGASDDLREGSSAWAERRKPVFRGR